MDKNKERLSALFDGQLNDIESSEVLTLLESDKELQNELADYALIHSAMNDEDSKIISIDSIKKTEESKYLANKRPHCSCISVNDRSDIKRRQLFKNVCKF